jgi:anaerobic magnesium-protoporphyrin IX monomethyl ester cyclase
MTPPFIEAAIVFPPLWYYPYAPPDVAAVAATLRAAGHHVSLIDANMECADSLLSASEIGRCADVLELRREENEPARVIQAAVADAKATLRDQRFFEIVQHTRAAAVLRAAWGIVSRAHAPTVIDSQGFRMRYDRERISECLRGAQDAAQNPYFRHLTDSVLPRLVQMRPRLVGLVFVHPDQMIPLLGLAAAMRSELPECHVTVLGCLEDQVTFARFLRDPRHPEVMTLASLVDSVILHEADVAIVRVANALAEGQAPRDVPNLATFGAEGARLPQRVEALDVMRLPRPDYDGLPLDLYPFPERTLPIVAARGCYWNRCDFCAITTNQLSYRTREPATVAQDIEQLQRRHGVRFFHFRDMLVSPAFLRRFSEQALERRLDIRWTARVRFEAALSAELLALARAAGCVQLWFGLESASPRVLDAMDKGIRLPDVISILRACDAAGLGTHVLAMHGHPSETDDDVETTLRFLEEHAQLIDSVSYTDFILFSDSLLFDQAAKRGLSVPSRRSLLQVRFEHRASEEQRRIHARHLALTDRVQRAIPMPLGHLSHVAPMIERHGVRAWRKLRHTQAQELGACSS